MGQQQLLLIVLGVIIVGIAIVSGINLFAASAEQANRDAVMSDLLTLSSMARAYYHRPAVLGGGGDSFASFTIPAAMAQTANGTLAHIQTGHGPDHMHFEGTGTVTGTNGTDPIRIEVRITISETKVSKKN